MHESRGILINNQIKLNKLLQFSTKDNRALPKNWCEIEKIIQLNKLPRHCYHHYCCYVLAYAHAFNFKQKIERFHKQLKYGVFWSHNPKAYEELKDYLTNLKRVDWLYVWPDTKSSYNPRIKLNS